MDNFFYFVDTLIKNHPLFSVPLVFISGVLVSFTPCFYPLIPVILGIIGINSDVSRRKALLLSIIYVLGLSFTYTVLGLVSSLTGSMFGEFAKRAFFQFTAAIVFMIMGLVLLDIMHIPLTFSLNLRPKKMGYLGIFALGILSGLVVGGCTFPVLGSILALMVLNQNIFFVGLLLFIFSLGIGLIFIIVAVSEANLLEFLKKNAIFFLGIKKALGIMLVLISLYFLRRGFYLL